MPDDPAPEVGSHEFEKHYKGVFLDALTSREQSVLKLIAVEYTSEQISKILHVGKKTLEAHRESLLLKLKAENTAGLTKAAIVLGLIGAED